MAACGLSKSRKLFARTRLQKRSSVRRVLLETLEARQLLAVGPQLLSIQPNTGDLLESGDILNTPPKELVFRFDDSTGIDPNSLDGIRIVRSGDDGLFERASRATDFGTGGQTLVEFYAQEPGQAGNGIEIQFTKVSRNDTRAPIIRVSGRTISVELNSNPTLETRVEDILQAFAQDGDSAASDQVYALRLRGSQTIGIGRTTDATQPLVLTGANSAKASTDFNQGNNLQVRLVARDSGNNGLGITVSVTARDRGVAGAPLVTVNGKAINVELNSNPRYASTVQEFVDALNASDSLSSQLIEAQLVSGVGATRIGNAPITYSPMELTGVTDIEIVPAYVGIGDSDREVIFRFADPLPDDNYRIEILGQGIRTLTNISGQPFNGGASQSVAFELNLGAQVASVVPQPVTIDPATGAVTWDRTSEIDVYLSPDQMIDLSTVSTVNGLSLPQLTAERGTLYIQNSDTIVFTTGTGQTGVLNPQFYQLHSPQGTLTTADDPAAEFPVRIRYYPEANRVSLRFSRDLDRYAPAGGELRLRIGTNETVPLAPAIVDGLTVDPSDTLAGAQDLSSVWTPGAGGSQSVLIDSEIKNTSPLLLDFPGGSDEPGNRQIQIQDNLRLGADSVDGSSVIFYNFQGQLGVLNGSTLLNAITETQKQRVREVLSLYEQYIGVRFIESANLGMTIGVGDMRAIVPFPDVVGGTTPGVAENNQAGFTFYEAGNLISNGQPGTVLDIQDFSDADLNQFGGEFMRAAMQAVGKLLGLGDADELQQMTIQSFASVFAPGVGTEIVMPGDADILHGQYLYRPDSKDIDLYQFKLPIGGKISIEAFAERMNEASLLDSQIRLFQETPDGWQEVASNNDHYSTDSFLELELGQGNYIVGVSASGNATYDPAIADSGIGGRSEGRYQLRMDFQPPADSVLRDGDTQTGTEFDGDADGSPGGVFNFWFRPSNASNTKFVNKAASTSGNGSLATPYKNINAALTAAVPGDVVRILGNGGADKNFATSTDNLAYEIGFDNLGNALPDGSTFDVPKDVSVMIDAGAILKMRRSRVGVGSTSVNVDRSAGSLLVLGTPTLQTASGNILTDASGNALSGSVFFTSLNDASLGKNANPNVVGSTPVAGDWGGLDFRARVDAANPARENLEDQGIFLNWVSNADIRYGGGQVVVDGLSQVVTPIQLVDSRPAIINSDIVTSADAAMSATPDSFLESNFHSPLEQGAVIPFTVDYDRVGPEIYGNHLVGNSINGMQIRVRTPSAVEKLTVSGRFDDTDIVHYIPENLEIQGTPGGALQNEQAPSSTGTRLASQAGGTLGAGSYTYVFTTIDSAGNEGPASEPTRSLSKGSSTGSIVLSNLPSAVSRIYRSSANGSGPYILVGQPAASVGTFIDNGSDLGVTLVNRLPSVSARLDARLTIDPGIVVKSQGARIDVQTGGQLIAEGTDGNPVVFTSLNDNRYGAGGTFDTANRAGTQAAAAGDWGGIYVGHTSKASLDYAVIAFGGGTTRVEGGFSDFSAIEVHQADLRLTHSRIELNANGSTTTTDEDRGGRGTNSASTIFIRAAQPIIVDNTIINNAGPAVSANVSALNNIATEDYGRSTGLSQRYELGTGNHGPLIAENRLDNNGINGMVVRGGSLTTEGIWDDTSIVHVVQDEITVNDYHSYGGLRLNSSSNQSLVVKLSGVDAGFTATGTPLDNANRIGGSVQIIGQPGFPVILTSLNDNTVGAGFDLLGNVQSSTNNGVATAPAAGDWRSILLETYSNDRNVSIVSESESTITTAPRTNETPSKGQYLGALAENLKAGDENNRLGFQIQGVIAAPSDVDVYTFTAKAGTEVWLDIDRTDNSLDTVVELVDANGNTLALSDNSLSEESNPSSLFVSPQLSSVSVNPLRSSAPELYYSSAQGTPKDLFSTNPKDAGLRVSLPGQPGTSNLYHIRVRSSNLTTADSLLTPAEQMAKLTDAGKVTQGVTSGNYQLQVRLTEIDEVPGSSISYADIRYAQTGIRLVGVPGNSPLLGENAEVEANNNAFAGAQALGNLLQTNRQAISVAGNLDSNTDVDWFSFDIDYQSIRPTSIREYFSTILDVDYANGIGRPDTSMYVFNANGSLILGGLGSNVVDDQASPLNAAGNADLSRGSAGNLDPYVGTYELPAGRYFVAMTNSSRMPEVIDQFTNPTSTTPLLRLQPIESIQLIAEEHVGFNGGSTANAPIIPDLFTPTAEVEYGLGDLILYVSRDPGALDSSQTQIFTVNPFTGERQLGFNSTQNFDVQDIAFRDNGELRAFDRAVLGGVTGDLDNLVDYITVDTGTGGFTVTGASGMQTFHQETDTATPPVTTAVDSDDAMNPEAITFGTVLGQERGYFVGNRPTPAGIAPAFYGPPQSLANVGTTRPGPSYFTNILYEFDENTGAAISNGNDKTGAAQGADAGTAVRERGYIETRDLSGNQSTLLVTTETTSSAGGQAAFSIRDGNTFTLVDRTTGVPFNLNFEFDFGPEARINYDPLTARSIRDEMQFIVDGALYEFDTGSVLVVDALNGAGIADSSTVRIQNAAGTEVVFEFDNNGSVNGVGNVAIPYQIGSSQAVLVRALAEAISFQPGFGVQAEYVAGSNRISLIGASDTEPAVLTGSGISLSGNLGVSDPAAVRIPISEAATERQLVDAITQAMPGNIAVSYESGRINFSGALTADFQDLASTGIFVDQGSSGATRPGFIVIKALATDTAETTASRIATAINDLGTVGLSATTSGDNVQLFGATIGNAGPLSAAGIAPGGLVTGIATIGNTLYAVSDAGGLYQVNSPSSTRTGNIATYVQSSYDLVGIQFTGLVAGPSATRNDAGFTPGARLDGGTDLTGGTQVLFGIDVNGVVYAFNTSGQLQPVFANGATSVATGLSGANGLALAPLQTNPWTVTTGSDNTNREGDAGHGLPVTPNGTRFPNQDGGSSFYFGDSRAGNPNYNFAGGAAGAIESVPFSLAGLSAGDLPTLYFNYFLETENSDSFPGNNMEDAFRVYASGEDGNWVLLATNDAARDDTERQELFDNTGTWRQARLSLDALAGQENVKLRIEFSTAGGFGYGLQGGRGAEIRTLAGSRLTDGESLQIGGQRFEIEMGPTLTLPGGSALTSGDSITIEGNRYVFSDGTGAAVLAPDIAVPFAATDSSEDIANALRAAIQSVPAVATIKGGLSFSTESNEIISNATIINSNGQSVRLVGSGTIGDNTTIADPATDVDLVRIEVPAGATVNIRVNAAAIGSPLDSYLRVFDEQGVEIAANDNGAGGSDSLLSFAPSEAGVYFVGVSGSGNDAYNPALAGTAVAASMGAYEMQIDILRQVNPIVTNNRIQLLGASAVRVNSGNAIVLQGAEGTNGLPIRVSADMTTEEVALALQQAVADHFANGVTSVYKLRGGDTLDMTGLTVTDAGPFGVTQSFVGDQTGAFNSTSRAQNNNFEGVYVDDIIIGIAGRGEMVLGDTGNNTNFVADPDATNQILTGPYQLEIRGGDAYGIPTTTGFVITDSFTPDSRQAPGLAIQFNDASSMIAGDTFTVSDGPRLVTFEMDDVNDTRPVSAGNIALPFNTAVVNALTGGTTSETGNQIAARFRDLLNSSVVQQKISVAGNLVNNDRTGASSDTVVLIGNASTVVPLSIGTKIVSNGTGAQNRERPQGQIVINGTRVSNSTDFGIDIAAAPRDPVTNAPLTGSPRNTVTLNQERLAPGAVVMNSELLFNGQGGISVSGDTAGAGIPPAAVPFVRLVNNTVIGGSVTAVTDLTPEIFNNQIFDLGALAFADAVVSYNPSIVGGPAPLTGLDVATDALGVPDFSGTGEPVAGEGAVSLGRGGTITLEFQDNFLTGSNDASPDLMIFEVRDSEEVLVEISADGTNFTSVGRASAALPTINIDAFGFNSNSRIAFVRLTDVSTQGAQTGDSVGADIDAVGALTSVAADIYVGGGTGISVTSNSTATLLNNVVVNTSTGINVDNSSASTVVGGTVFQRNTSNVAGSATIGQFPNMVGANVPMFVDIAAGNLYPAPSSPLIDSSIDSLQDRPSIVAVKAPLGLATSPIQAPRSDINGQLRVDDPAVETPSGLGENVFKDRGAQDRADFVGPSVVMTNPVDNDLAGQDRNPSDSIVELSNVSLRYFDIQMFDGLEPTDPNRGAGIDHSTVTGSSVLVYRDGVPLVEGVNYTFGYDSTNGVIRLTPLTGVWPSESVYTVRFVNTTESAIVAQAANAYQDGDTFDILDTTGSRTSFEFDLGYLLTVPAGDDVTPPVVDGTKFVLDDGSRRLTFEFDSNGVVSADTTTIAIGTAPTAESVARAMENAINNSGLSVTVSEIAAGQLQIQGSRLTQLDPQDSGLTVVGQPGVRTAFGIQIPLEAGVPAGVDDGQFFVVDRSGSPVVFELDTNGITQPDTIPVRFSAGGSAADIGQALVDAINSAALGLSPTYAGDGLITLGGDANTSLDMTGTTLTQSGLAAQPAAIAIALSADPNVSASDVASAIEQAIDAENITGITTTQFGGRVILEGASGVAGVGAGTIGSIQDLAGNPLKSNQLDGSTTLTIVLGEGLDYGDAPAPYKSTKAEGGPSHTVVSGLSLGATVSVDADAKLTNADNDDGLTFTSTIYSAFSADGVITVNNTTGKAGYVSLWIDFNGDGNFANSERILAAEQVTGSTVPFTFSIPEGLTTGETYARVRLSTDASSITSPTGTSPDGEVEDHLITLEGNPYQNQRVLLGTGGTNVGNLDVSNDGFISPIDVLQVITYLNSGRPNQLTLPVNTDFQFLDVNGDGVVAPIDALVVINYLNSLSPVVGGEGEGEGEAGSTSTEIQTVLASDWAPGLETRLASPTTPERSELAQDAVNDLALLDSEEDDSAAYLAAASQSALDSLDSVWAELDSDDADDSLVGDDSLSAKLLSDLLG
ncbi:GEVED domain-containing protein [Aureliella helgolandensis]|uniref:Dockerin type I repeat protein n=1 Tax=Aureliella helgolandensis TaxID=2527968 RepID=A0A518GG20_9BACT|nr:GEVED domain-containing protein [Aureliella helgolandensis]QDV27539.1 hypothetical protein Q31a_59280 [Aureliella helgolandensis]